MKLTEVCSEIHQILIRNKEQTDRNLLTVFHQRALVLAFCTLLEVFRRFVGHLCPDKETHLDGTNFAFIKHTGINLASIRQTLNVLPGHT